ncbi:hypothetical protein K431DRAFT_224141 [Polychaeton citri CBS 116435]|uniref:Uncharacterized protein n=1 Tax=Polychaeton citri CBS 116435 TaxID=1314669 RepID=A0A9P4QAT5_9PEZI|nr:hypothetical protein K431DRAFT_224141 [Polychaeton citri CBS 116435]
MSSPGVPPSPHYSPSHSRDSSGASNVSSPITSTFSNRGHNRWPSSTSSIGTQPDSPVNVSKSPLHDLVEDPAERDDANDGSWTMGGANGGSEDQDVDEEPLCICDTPFCEHRRPSIPTQPASSPAPEWTPGDDYFADGTASLPEPSSKRRRSGHVSRHSLSQRLSKRWPSLSKRGQDHQPMTSVSSFSVHSAPPSRSVSMRLPSARRALAGHVDDRRSCTSGFVPPANTPEKMATSSPKEPATPISPINIPPIPGDDPIDRQELARTPLLPPVLDHKHETQEELQSPLQSPTIAVPGSGYSAASTPVSGPLVPGMITPPLSAKPSTASMRLGHQIPPTSEIPPIAISEEQDPWAIRLGHANFHIYPKPYLPTLCTGKACRQLLDDWESARLEYMRHAARISEHYGPTSHTFKLSEQKWAEIDATWRSYHEEATSQAEACGEAPHFQSLAQTAPLSKMPSMEDDQPEGKFPKVDQSDIVGPMVQYARIHRQPSKRHSILRIFTDPTSLISRSSFNMRR